MKITQITFEKTYPYQLSRYQIGKIVVGGIALVEPGETADEAMQKLQDFAEAKLLAELELLEGEGLTSDLESPK